VEALVQHRALSPPWRGTTQTGSTMDEQSRSPARSGERAPTRPANARPAPFPHQLRLTSQWRRGISDGLDPTSRWAGQSAALSTTEPGGEVIDRRWRDASALLAWPSSRCGTRPPLHCRNHILNGQSCSDNAATWGHTGAEGALAARTLLRCALPGSDPRHQMPAAPYR
jgi:hypothetical protein